ncbi:MAG: ABC transporter permease [Vicinamibacteria bacterium]|nr:ABC transporter permease [Vicinamibacteria bacterium]
MSVAIPVIYNIRSVRVRWVSAVVSVVGIAGSVGVFIAMLALANGFEAALATSGSPLNAKVRRAGTTSEMESGMSLDETRIIGDAPGVARGADNAPLVSAEVVIVTALPKAGYGTDANVAVRGVSPQAAQVHDKVRITEGRYFEPGIAELIVGRGADRTIEGLALGDRPRFGGREWTVVGLFDADGSAFDSEIWCDARLLNESFGRPAGVSQSATVRLDSPESFNAFKDALTSDPRLTVMAQREQEYYADRSTMISTLIRSLGFLVAIVMGVGSIFGALNTMYSAVAARAREIATLRALGFGPGSVVVSFVFESLLIALVGGAVGGLMALPVNGVGVSTMNWQTFSHLAFAFRVTPPLLLYGLIFALIMGFVGGLLPAVRAARLPVASALREL